MCNYCLIAHRMFLEPKIHLGVLALIWRYKTIGWLPEVTKFKDSFSNIGISWDIDLIRAQIVAAYCTFFMEMDQHECQNDSSASFYIKNHPWVRQAYCSIYITILQAWILAECVPVPHPQPSAASSRQHRWWTGSNRNTVSRLHPQNAVPGAVLHAEAEAGQDPAEGSGGLGKQWPTNVLVQGKIF